MKKWLRKFRVKLHIGYSVEHGENINVTDVASLFGVDADVIHKICARYIKKGWLQRLYNTPPIDYYPIGQYRGMFRLPHPDGAQNPFLTDDGQVKPEIKRLLTAKLCGDQHGLWIEEGDNAS